MGHQAVFLRSIMGGDFFPPRSFLTFNTYQPCYPTILDQGLVLWGFDHPPEYNFFVTQHFLNQFLAYGG